jgi:hypothetical protein
MAVALGTALLFAAPAFAQSDASPEPSPSATPAATVDPAIAKRAADWFHRVQTGSIDRTQLTPDFSARLTDANVSALAAQLADLGDPVTFDFVREIDADVTTYIFRITFKSALKLSWSFSLDPSGKIAKFALKPGG